MSQSEMSFRRHITRSNVMLHNYCSNRILSSLCIWVTQAHPRFFCKAGKTPLGMNPDREGFGNSVGLKAGMPCKNPASTL